LGYNDSEPANEEQGFFWDGNIDVSLSQELDNGVTAGVTFDFDFADDNLGEAVVASDYVLSLTTETAGLYFGDIAFAAETQWAAAGDMEADGFSEADGETAIRGDMSYGGFDASVSYVIANNDGVENVVEDLNQLSIGVSGSVANFNVAVAYQAESDEAATFYNGLGNADNGDFSNSEIYGVSVSTAVAGATVRLAYASNETANENSTGIQVSYPFGPVTTTVYYVSEDDGGSEDNYGATVAYAEGPFSVTLDYDYDQGVNKVGLDGAYDLGNGLTILAGMYDQSDDTTAANNGTDTYVAATYDLGSGAELLVSYTDAETAGALADDEVGGPDYMVGTTVEVSFKF
jgi:outer membrane protein OmpU